MSIIHHTRGVYANGSYKDNGVLAEDLEAHIEYNIAMRPGRALLVDGVVVWEGYVPRADLKLHQENVRVFKQHTRPYQ